jgi:hypothetical protein
MNEEDKLARLDVLDPSQMRPEFREGLARLTQLIFNKVRAWVAGGGGAGGAIGGGGALEP